MPQPGVNVLLGQEAVVRTGLQVRRRHHEGATKVIPRVCRAKIRHRENQEPPTSGNKRPQLKSLKEKLARIGAVVLTLDVQDGSLVGVDATHGLLFRFVIVRAELLQRKEVSNMSSLQAEQRERVRERERERKRERERETERERQRESERKKGSRHVPSWAGHPPRSCHRRSSLARQLPLVSSPPPSSCPWPCHPSQLPAPEQPLSLCERFSARERAIRCMQYQLRLLLLPRSCPLCPDIPGTCRAAWCQSQRVPTDPGTRRRDRPHSGASSSALVPSRFSCPEQSHL
jgi:hypothetical protein